MGRCEICGGDDAYIICPRCKRLVCNNCFNSEAGVCILCLDREEIGRESLLGGRLPFPAGSTFIGMALIIFGMLLMMVASILSASGEGVIVIFPFIIGRVSGLTALIIMIAFMIISLAVFFLPWLLGPGRVLRVIERVAGLEKPELKPLKVGGRGSGEVEEYIITLRMPGFREEDIDVRVFGRELHVRAYKDGRLSFTRRYELPRGFEPYGVRYNYEDDFLIVKVALRYVGEEA